MKKLLFLLLFFSVVATSYAPPPDLTTIMIHGVACGPHGDAKEKREYDANPYKNRFTNPKPNDFDYSIDLEKMRTAKEGQDGFSNDKAVSLKGYVLNVKPGGKETCNCHTTDPAFKDTHIELVLDPSKDDPSNVVIVEVTPRMREIEELQGENWSTDNLQQTILHKYVRIEGWLFYDIAHSKENFADNPDGEKNWRATSWEVHPITNIQIDADAEETVRETNSLSTVETDNDEDNNTSPSLISVKRKSSNISSNNTTMNTTPTPQQMLVVIALGAILGMVGQGIRVLVGLKKMQDFAATTNTSKDDLYQAARLIMSFVIALLIGVIAGVIAALTKIGTTLDKSVLFAFVAAGYAGTDFIEGFLRKEGADLTKGTGTTTTTTTTVTPPKNTGGQSPV